MQQHLHPLESVAFAKLRRALGRVLKEKEDVDEKMWEYEMKWADIKHTYSRDPNQGYLEALAFLELKIEEWQSVAPKVAAT